MLWDWLVKGLRGLVDMIVEHNLASSAMTPSQWHDVATSIKRLQETLDSQKSSGKVCIL